MDLDQRQQYSADCKRISCDVKPLASPFVGPSKARRRTSFIPFRLACTVQRLESLASLTLIFKTPCFIALVVEGLRAYQRESSLVAAGW